MSSLAESDRTRLRREAHRGSHDAVLIRQIIDAALICHLGLTDHDGHPLVVPTIHARIDDVLYVHGSAASRTMRRLATGTPACCTITHLDGLVAARSGFWSSMNFRSVMIFGTARLVEDPTEAIVALDAIVDHVLPGRSAEIRRPTTKELAASKVLAIPIDQASAKIRSGDPDDDPADLASDVWAGTVPVRVIAGAPVSAANLPAGIPPSPSVLAVRHRIGSE
jgi:nitroimidazol reductase NimA-like FMN-containing flavoprotein (pyridoxamine 5'-phosphate oxidase superfamily)